MIRRTRRGEVSKKLTLAQEKRASSLSVLAKHILILYGSITLGLINLDKTKSSLEISRTIVQREHTMFLHETSVGGGGKDVLSPNEIKQMFLSSGAGDSFIAIHPQSAQQPNFPIFSCWVCDTCTYQHNGFESELTHCSVCYSPKTTVLEPLVPETCGPRAPKKLKTQPSSEELAAKKPQADTSSPLLHDHEATVVGMRTGTAELSMPRSKIFALPAHSKRISKKVLPLKQKKSRVKKKGGVSVWVEVVPRNKKAPSGATRKREASKPPLKRSSATGAKVVLAERPAKRRKETARKQTEKKIDRSSSVDRKPAIPKQRKPSEKRKKKKPSSEKKERKKNASKTAPTVTNEVETVLEVRSVAGKSGKGRQALVRWKGFSEADDSWEPVQRLKHLDAWKRFKQFQARKITCAKNMSTIKQGLPGVAKKGFGSGKIDDEDASSEGTESDTCSFDAAARQPQKEAAKRQGKVKTAVSVARLERKQAEAEHAAALHEATPAGPASGILIRFPISTAAAPAPTSPLLLPAPAPASGKAPPTLHAMYGLGHGTALSMHALGATSLCRYTGKLGLPSKLLVAAGPRHLPVGGEPTEQGAKVQSVTD